MIKIFLLLIYVLGMIIGQILFKKISILLTNESSFLEKFENLIFNPLFIFGITLYGVLTIYWIWLLSKFPISVAYPFSSLSIAIIVLLGWFNWGEKFSYYKLIGVIMIIIGVVLVGLSHEK